MINYIIQVILFQILFLTIYDFFLSKETFFTKNRWYLLSTPILSFLLPLIKIPTFQKVMPQEYIVYLPEIILSPEKVIQETSLYQSMNYIDIIFWLGFILFSILFLVKLVKIISLIRSYKLLRKEGYTLVLIPNQTKAFSFFNYIFLGKEIPESQKEQIIAHELVHSKQKHSLDLLFFEFLKIVMWFNPMIFIYQKRITLVHEYISDEVATKSELKENYINQLLSNFFQVENIAFINQFYKQTLIKKRIIMMKKNKSKKMNQLKYLVLIPVLISMLFYTSCASNKYAKNTSKEKTIVYIQNGNNVETKTFTDKSYLDKYVGADLPNSKEFFIADLSDLEKEEYNRYSENFLDKSKGIFRIFEAKHGRKMIYINFSIMKRKTNSKEDLGILEIEETRKDTPISFLKIDTSPTFPGCETGDKNCFSLMIQQHFVKNFDSEMPKTLGLSFGKKRIFIAFKVDTIGNITDVKARAPHPKIEEEVIRVMNSLPKMIPGKQDDKTVAVNFTIPFTIMIDKKLKKE